MPFRILRLAGRCANGAERDGGTNYHAVPGVERNGFTSYPRALCGAEPGRRSAGWSDYAGQAVTCPRCLRIIARRALQTVRARRGSLRAPFTPQRGEEAL